MSLVKKLPRKTAGRYVAVGDIHGNFTKLQDALDASGFNPDAGDELIFVGDLVDRGPESDQATVWLERPYVHAVRGNHEDMAMRWPNGRMDTQNYVDNGGGWNVANLPAESRRIADAFSVLPIAMEVETAAGRIGIVHAECPTESWDDFTRMLDDRTLSNTYRKGVIEHALWSRQRVDGMFVDKVTGVEAVVVGHTPVNRFTSLGNTLYIDTGLWLPRGHVTLLDLDTLRPIPVPGQQLQWD